MTTFEIVQKLLKFVPLAVQLGVNRAVRTGIAAILAGVFTSIADGSILTQITVIPGAYIPTVLMGLTVFFMGVDKWLRERGLVDDSALDIPTSEAVTAPSSTTPTRPVK